MTMFSFAKGAVAVGSPAPAPTVTTQERTSLDLAAEYGKGPVLIYFYPKADTPGCTQQACNLRDNFAELRAAGVTVLGVSTDKPGEQKAFQEKYQLPFTLIADHEGVLGAAFGVGKVPLVGVYSRQAFLIVDGKVVWHDPKAKPASQAEDALAALAAHRKAGTAS